MPFDVNSALKEGYSETEVVDFLAKEKKFDVDSARKEGYTDNELIQYLNPAPKKQGLLTDLQRGYESMKGNILTGGAGLLNPTEAAKKGLEREEEVRQRLGPQESRLSKVEKAYEDKGLLSAIGTGLSEIPGAITEQIPQLGTRVAGARLGAMASAPIVAGLTATGVGAPVAGAIGLAAPVAGFFLPSFLNQYGGNIKQQASVQKEKGEEVNVSGVMGAGFAAPMAALDFGLAYGTFGKEIIGKILGPSVQKLLNRGLTKEAEEAVAKKLASESFLPSLKGLDLGTIVKGTSKASLIEIPTEVTQQLLGRAQSGQDLFSKEAMREYGETAFDVALLGPLGVLGRVSDKSAAKQTILRAQQEAAKTGQPQEIPIDTINDQGQVEQSIFFVDSNGAVGKSLDDFKFKDVQEKRTEELRKANQPAPPPVPPILERDIEVQTPEVMYGGTMGEIGTSPEAVQQVEQLKLLALQKQQEAKNVISKEMFTNLGIGKTAKITRGDLLGQNLSNPAAADKVREGLLEIRKDNSNPEVIKNIDQFLQKPEFNTLRAKEESLIPEGEGKFISVFAPGPNGYQSYEAEVLEDKKGNARSVTYQDDAGQIQRVNSKSKNVIVAPTEADLKQKELEHLEETLKSIQQERDAAGGSDSKFTNEFKAWLRKNPLTTKQAEEVGVKQLYNRNGIALPIRDYAHKGYLSPKGLGSDELALAAYRAGFLTDVEYANSKDTEGENAFMDMVRGVLEPRGKLQAKTSIEDEVRFRQADEAANHLQEEIDARRKELERVPNLEEIASQELGREPIEPQPTEFAEVPYEATPALKQNIDELTKKIQKSMDKMGLHGVGVTIGKELKSLVNGKMTKVNGLYLDRLIVMSLDSPNIMSTFGHEQLHALRDLGMFSDREWQVLSAKAKTDWIKKYDIERRYKGKSEEVKIEEAIASAFGDYTTMGGAPRSLLARIKEFFERLGNAFRSMGFQTSDMVFNRTAEDVFRKATEGRLEGAGRAGTGEAMAEEGYKNVKIFPDFNFENKSKWFKAQSRQDREKGYVNSFNNPITLKDGSRLSGFTDPKNQTTFHGYKKNGERFSLRVNLLNPEDIVSSRDQNKTANYLKESLIELKQSSEPMFEISLEGVEPKVAQMAETTFGKQEPKSYIDTVKDLAGKYRDRFRYMIADDLADIKQYSEAGYMKGRLSKTVDTQMQVILDYGQLEARGGTLGYKKGTKGLKEIYAPLGNEVERYQIWLALNRDANLPSDKRSFKDDLVKNRDQFIQGDINGVPRKEVYEKARVEQQALNKSVLDVSKKLGLIDDKAYQRFANDAFYIPFYKEMENGDVEGARIASRLTGQKFSHALQGGEKKVNDLMDNMLRNWSHIISASLKNDAALTTLKDAEKLGVATRVKEFQKGNPDVVKVMEDGVPTYFKVEDQNLIDNIAQINYVAKQSALFKAMTKPSNWLRYGVTLNPAYKIRNIIKDTMTTVGVSAVDPNMLNNVRVGWNLTNKASDQYADALASGAVFQLGSSHDGKSADLIKRLVAEGVNDSTILNTQEKMASGLKKAFKYYEDLGNRLENVNRMALYDKLIKDGKSPLEAAYESRDLLDFTSQGASRSLKVLSQLVPFMNTRVQGLYKLYRTGTDADKQQRLFYTLGAIAIASMALYMMNKDDEDFRKRQDWDRDNFWWFKIGDTAFRIPKPYEIGGIGTLAERGLEQFVDDSVESKLFFSRMGQYVLDTLSLDPTPQAIKPMWAVLNNRDSFNDTPIETPGMERYTKTERYSDKTSGVAKGISQAINMPLSVVGMENAGPSPVQIDYLAQGYFGWLGGLLGSTAARAFEDKPTKPLLDATGLAQTEPETNSKYLTDFYKSNAKIQNNFNDLKRYAEQGNTEKVNEILTEKGDLIALQKLYNQTVNQIAEQRKYIQFIGNQKEIPAEERQQMIVAQKIIMSKMAENVETIRKSLKNK